MYVGQSHSPQTEKRHPSQLKGAGASRYTPIALPMDEHLAASHDAQRQADKWLTAGALLIGTAALGVFGLPLFLRGIWLLREAQRKGLSGATDDRHPDRLPGDH